MKTHLLAGSLVVAATLPPSAFAAASPGPIPTTEAVTTVTSTDPATAVKPRVLEAFEVTGSRIKRLDYETPAPVVTYTAVDIERSGFTTVGEFIQSLPFNSDSTNSELTTNGFVTGSVTANPRGLGSNRFLTLINGRRGVPYGLTNGINGSPVSVFNLNSVPFSAVERVEYLKDGSSALYGSDAITGAMNLILKKNYSGTSVDFSATNTPGHDSLNRRVSVFTGVAKNGWDISVGAENVIRHSSFLQDTGLTSTDFRYLGVKGSNFLSVVQNPSPIILSVAQATASGIGTVGGYYVVTGGAPSSNPTKAGFTYVGTTNTLIPNANRYDPVKDQQLSPASDSSSVYGNLNRRLNPNLSAFAQFTFNRGKTYYETQPFGYNTTGLTLPATNPYNPLGVSLVNGPTNLFYFKSTGARPQRQVLAASAMGVVGLRGTALKIWEWESGVSYGYNRAILSQDQIRMVDLQTALSGTTRATAYNPFGPSDNPDLVPGLFTRVRMNDNLADSFTYNATASANVWQIPLRSAGEVGVATGYEFRRESLDARPNAVAYLGTSGGAPFGGHRQTHSVFVEFKLPVQKWLEVQLAARHENYSDFGQTTKPKVAALLRLPANKLVHVLLRGSYSESFKAPDFGQLYQTPTAAFGGLSVVDPLRPQEGAHQYNARLGGNPDLGPEDGKVQYFGAVLEVQAIRGLSFSADYFDIKLRDVVGLLEIEYLFSPEGMRLYPDAIVRDNSRENPGPVSYFHGNYRNVGFQLARNWDFGVSYALPRTRYGNFGFRAAATQIIKSGDDRNQGRGFVDRTGRYRTPVWRGNFSTSWSYRSVSASVSANVIGKYFNDGFTTAGWGENVYAIFTPSFTYRGFKNLSVTLSSYNVLDNLPPPNGRAVRGFDLNMYSLGAQGRTFSLRARKEF